MMDFDWFDIDDWMLIGPLSEDLADEEIRRKKLEQDYDDLDQDEENY